MRTHTLTALLKCNKDLQLRATSNYWKLLNTVCHVHADQPWSRTALAILDLGPNRESVRSLVDLADSLSSQKYDDAAEHFAANQFSLLIRKYPFPDDVNPFTPEETAYQKFIKSEHSCLRINQRLSARRSRRSRPLPYEYEFEKMRQFARYVLADAPDLAHIYDNVGFGPGASVGVTGNATNFARKLRASWTVTPGAYMLSFGSVMKHAQIREILFPNPGGFTASPFDYDPVKGPFSKKVSVVAYNKIAFVPKTAKTYRSIAVEPLLNGLVQKGVDNVMRLRLKRIGIDLSDQDLNSEMARLGSLKDDEDSFVTIDLSSASDSISIEIVREILPPEWFSFLNSIRSPSYNYGGVVRRFHKFCSMGNGFCFPLETLLFTSACISVGCGAPGKDFRVYGDDIVVRKKFAVPLLKLLKYMGFAVNTDKTFLSGPFRESCGKDWFNGVDVRPYTLDFALDSVQSLYKVLNGSLRNDLTRSFFHGLRPFLLGRVHRDFRFFRPYPGPDDTAIDSYCDEFLTSPHVSYRFANGTGSWRWKELISYPISDREITNWAREHGIAVLYGALSGSASSMPFSIRRKTRTKVRLVSHPGATSQWLPPVGRDAVIDGFRVTSRACSN